MEYLLDRFKEEVEIVNKNSFLTYFSLLISIVLFSKTSRLHSNLLKAKLMNYYPLQLVGCHYFMRFNFGKENDLQLNKDLTVAELIEFLKSSIHSNIERGKHLKHNSFKCIVEQTRDVNFMVSLDIDNIELVIKLILDSFSQVSVQLQDLKFRYNNLQNKIGKHDFISNAVKGNPAPRSFF